MLDRDESGLHATQLSIEGRALLDDPSLILADIRDADRVDEIFATHRPEVVFHAAALKHLPLLEMHPDEAWKTNVAGTLVLLDAARRHGVDRFVNVSTDKAADPTSVLGWTKRITERLTAHASAQGPTECVSVRFGNVLGSSGSVLKAFEAQSASGGPITVTDPEITRYFMTIEEAVAPDDLRRGDRGARRGPDPRHGRAGPHRRRRRAVRATSTRRRSRSCSPGCARTRSCTST